MAIDKHHTIEAIKAKLLTLTEEQPGRSIWSGLIKKVFIDLARDQGVKVATAGYQAMLLGAEKPKWGEWLYDLVWYTSEHDELSGIERTTSVPLVMECEWNASLDEIALDFDKLLVANADLRVMVCGEYPKFLREPLLAHCKRTVQGYRGGQLGDTFLVCIVPEKGPAKCEKIVRE